MNAILSRKSSIQVEPLEQRIAPAVLTDFGQVVVGTPILLDADPTTGFPAGITAGLNGVPLLYVEKGSCLVFTNDYNGNNIIDFNEITGIAAGDGLRLISFVDIHGDIVTNLRPDGTLTDSDGNASNGRDGQILLNSKIESIELRSIRQAELPLGVSLDDKIALSSYSIFGNIYAGGGFGTLDGGLTIDTSGISAQQDRYDGSENAIYVTTKPQIGSIRVGTAASGKTFSFGASNGDDVAGKLQTFTPPSNAPGADIINVRALDPSTRFNLGTLQAGDGGFNGRGGDLVNIIISGDTAGGYGLIAGNAGPGPTGQRGGNIQNWVDLGSVTSEVVIKTGNGGQGLVGKGGDGGSVTFGNALAIDHDNDPATPPITPESAASVTARLKITLGNGGSGLTAGGNGGSFPNGKFTALEPSLAFPLELVSTWHQPKNIGQLISLDENGVPLTSTDARYHALRGIDFDGDGANDIVYTTVQSNGNQAGSLVVLFGDPSVPGAIDPDRTLFLDAPDNPDALTIGDFNGDGKPDIAVASGTMNLAGIQIILSTYDSLTGAFTGFGDSIYSPMPAINGGIVAFGLTPNRGPHAFEIFELASGDFNDDGAVDIGVMTSRGFFLLRGDLDPGANGTTPTPTGKVFSDTASNGGFIAGDLRDRVRGEFPVIKASAMGDNTQDVIFATVQGERFVSAYNYTGAFLTNIEVALGDVDTNREVSDAGKTDKISLAPATTKDFTFLDFNGDGRTEISVLTSSPEGFLVNKSDSDGAPGALFETFISNRFSGLGGNNADENKGIRIGGQTGPSNFGLALSDGGLVGIMTHTTRIGDTHVNSVMVVDYEVQPDNQRPVTGNILRFAPPAPLAGESPNYSVVSFSSLTVYDPRAGFGYENPDQTVRAFDVYMPSSDFTAPTTPAAGTFILGLPSKDAPLPFVPGIAGISDGFFLIFTALERNGFFLKAGDGGDSANGKGGLGGLIGSTLRFDPTTGQAIGSFDILLPSFAQFFAGVRIVAGDGGDGFRDAGAGGTIAGLSVRHPIEADVLSNSGLLLAGAGGNSIKGKGGKGGDVKSVFVEGGDLFVAGNGGNGVIGGQGGSVLGNRLGLDDVVAVADLIDNVQGVTIVVFAGDGGSGVRAGGVGGDIVGFTPRFLTNLGINGSYFHLRSGDGGNSTIGTGGRGGNILDSSPVTDDNKLNGSIFVLAGSGGNGTKGGAGGNIREFTNITTGTGSAFSTTFLAGNGGIGTSGAGGLGGSIVNVRTDGTGVGRQAYFDFSDRDNIEFLSEALIGFNIMPFSRMVAGEGGTSLGGAGGNGGSIMNVIGTASTSTFAMAGGRGGDGLSKGGNGGSVLNAESGSGSQNVDTTEFGTPITKPQVLIIAGEGGDAYSGVVRSNDPLVPGRKLPVGGNGGSIVDFRQPTGADVNVQLIAGNGGNTPNAGSTIDVKSKVGRGGSIQNIFVAGRIGDTGDPEDGANAPIKAYNPILVGPPNPGPGPGPNDPVDDRMSYFVRNSLVGTPEVVPLGLLAIPLVNGDDGNVGIVVGAKGRVRDGNNDGVLDPAPDVSGSVPNGSLINVQAGHILSAVADHVERIASIQVLRNVQVTIVGGELGSDRNIDTTGAIQSIDGVPFELGAIPGSLDYLRPDGTHSPTPVIGGRLVDGAIVAKTSRTPLSDRDFKIG